MIRKLWGLPLIVIVCALLAAPALASQMLWNFQSAEVPELLVANPETVALGMRTGATWPTVFYQAQNSQLVASSLTPAGWLGSVVATMPGSGTVALRGQAAPDGQVGVAWQLNNILGMVQSSRHGWQSNSPGTITTPMSQGASAADLAYLSNGRPVMAYADGGTVQLRVNDGLTWNSDVVSVMPGGSSKSYASIATDSQDHLGVAYAESGILRFATKDIATGQWYGAEVRGGFAPSPRTRISIEFGLNDRVAISVLDNTGLSVSSFDIQTGKWGTSWLASEVFSVSDLVYDSQGRPALAYVTAGLSNPEVHYVIHDGSGWVDSVLPAGVDAASGLNVTPLSTSVGVALAFDGEDLPVIAYKANGTLVLAYDPVVVPEPASLVMLLVGLVLVRRR